MNKVSLCSMVVMGALLLGCSKSPGDLNQEQSSLSTMTEAQAKELALQEVGSGSIMISPMIMTISCHIMNLKL